MPSKYDLSKVDEIVSSELMKISTVHDQQMSDIELAICRLTAMGLMNKEIANVVGLVESTVKIYQKKVSARLGLRTRTKIAAWVIINGKLK